MVVRVLTLALTALLIVSAAAAQPRSKAENGVAELNGTEGIVISEPLTTPPGGTYTLEIRNSRVQAGDQAAASAIVADRRERDESDEAYHKRTDGLTTRGRPIVMSVTAANKVLTVVIRNEHASAALNGSVRVTFAVYK